MEKFQSILSNSKISQKVKSRPSKPKFKGGFSSYSISTSINRETRVESRLHVFSQGSRAKVHRYLFLKFLWDELTRDEYELFIQMSETLNSEVIIGALRATLLIGKKKVRQRILSHSIEGKNFSREVYNGYRRLDIEIHEYQRSLPKTTKFSGWVRSSSQVGSKNSRGSSFLEPLDIHEEDYMFEIFDWYTFLTVGD